MREILYKGKRVGNGEWVIGNLEWFTENDSVTITKHNVFPTEIYTVIPETVGQFTGQTDKNGKLAFEGDLINSHFGSNVGVIRYGEYKNPFGDDKFAKHIGFYVEWLSGDKKDKLRMDLGYWLPAVEIIGNIHDKPDTGLKDRNGTKISEGDIICDGLVVKGAYNA